MRGTMAPPSRRMPYVPILCPVNYARMYIRFIDHYSDSVRCAHRTTAVWFIWKALPDRLSSYCRQSYVVEKFQPTTAPAANRERRVEGVPRTTLGESLPQRDRLLASA